MNDENFDKIEFIAERVFNDDEVTLRFKNFHEIASEEKRETDLPVMAAMLLELAAERGELNDVDTIERIQKVCKDRNPNYGKPMSLAPTDGRPIKAFLVPIDRDGEEMIDGPYHPHDQIIRFIDGSWHNCWPLGVNWKPIAWKEVK